MFAPRRIQRRRDLDRVAVADEAREDAARAAPLADVRRELGPRELNAGDEGGASADGGNAGVVPERLERRRQHRGELARAVNEPLPLDDVEVREARDARRRVPSVRWPVAEDSALPSAQNGAATRRETI